MKIFISRWIRAGLGFGRRSSKRTATFAGSSSPSAITAITPTIALLSAAAALLVLNAVLLSRIEGFAWGRFRQVAGWVLAAYVVIAGMLEYVFVYDHTSGTQLLILTLMLAVFAVNVPMLLGFSVARFDEPEG